MKEHVNEVDENQSLALDLDNLSFGDDVLAIVVPHHGQPTETFIRRYCEELMPGRVVLIHFYEGCGSWRIDAPTFFLSKAVTGSSLAWKAFRGMQKLFFGSSLFSDPYSAWRLERFLKQHRVTVVFSQYLIAGWNVHNLVKRLGIRHVVRGHGFDVSSCLDNDQWRIRFMDLADAYAIVVPSPYQIRRLREIGLGLANLVCLPYGTDYPEDVVLAAFPRDERHSFIRVLAVGRMVAKKDPFSLVKAFLRASKQIPGLTLTYIGGGPLLASVQDFVSVNDPDGLIELVGPKGHDEVYAAMRNADIFMQHSVTDPVTGDQEGAPVAVIEAMANGLPIVSTNHSGIPYLVEDERCGLLTAEGDVDGMADSLVKLAGSAEMRAAMGHHARLRARSFTWAHEREMLLGLLLPSANGMPRV
jgi:colanic acid/amylovoran biosynthesis glycosyltransferase